MLHGAAIVRREIIKVVKMHNFHNNIHYPIEHEVIAQSISASAECGNISTSSYRVCISIPVIFLSKGSDMSGSLFKNVTGRMNTLKMVTINLLLFVIIFCGITHARYINAGGSIVENTVWSADTVFFTTDVIVEKGATLTINPGTVVLCSDSVKDSIRTDPPVGPSRWETFNRPPEFSVKGCLLAVGNETDSITFDRNPASGGEEYWPGIRFDTTSSSNDSSKIIFCSIRSAAYGITCRQFSKLLIHKSTIYKCGYYSITERTNTKGSGGGIYCFESSPVISDNRIEQCIVNYSGGGIYCSKSDPLILNNTITNNIAHPESYSGTGYGAGIYCQKSSPRIEGNTISKNRADRFGGGICCNDSSSPLIVNNIITENSIRLSDTAVGNAGAGICCLKFSHPVIDRNRIIHNSSNLYGGGIYCNESSPLIINTLIYANRAKYGAGILLDDDSHPRIVNTTIVGNHGQSKNNGIYRTYENSVYHEDPVPKIINTIVWGNTYGADTLIDDAQVDYPYGGGRGLFTLAYSCVYKLEDDYTEGRYIGNISADPMFTDPANGDFSLKSGSPCINKGSTDSLPETFALDAAGNPRFNGGSIDMGAFEYLFIGAPVLRSPSDGSVNHPVSLSLVWSSVATATGYHFQIAADSLFKNPVSEDTETTDTVKAVESLSKGTVYYWRVRALKGDDVSTWTSGRFTTASGILDAPVLTSPSDGSGQPASLSFIWRSVNTATGYHIQIAGDALFTELVLEDSDITDTVTTVEYLTKNTTYYWRVKARNDDGASTWSEVHSFNTSGSASLEKNSFTPQTFSFFRSSGSIRYCLPERCRVSVKYYDIGGRMVESYVNNFQNAGNHTLALPRSSLSAGAYLQVFTAGRIIRTNVVTVTR